MRLYWGGLQGVPHAVPLPDFPPSLPLSADRLTCACALPPLTLCQTKHDPDRKSEGGGGASSRAL